MLKSKMSTTTTIKSINKNVPTFLKKKFVFCDNFIAGLCSFEAGYDRKYGLFYFHARHFNGDKFLSKDPASPDLEQPLSLNPYQYCYNNPLKYTDPDGRDVIGIHGGANGNWTGTEGMMWNYRNMLASTVFKDVPAISLNFQHSGFNQSNPNHAASLISSYQHQNDSLKIFWGHSMGADSVAQAFGQQGMAWAAEINLVMPRASFVADNLQMMSQNAGKVNVFMLSKDFRNYAPGYGDRSFETMGSLLQGMKLPSNVNIMQINGFSGTGPHGGALEQGSPVLDSIWNQYQGTW